MLMRTGDFPETLGKIEAAWTSIWGKSPVHTISSAYIVLVKRREKKPGTAQLLLYLAILINEMRYRVREVERGLWLWQGTYFERSPRNNALKRPLSEYSCSQPVAYASNHELYWGTFACTNVGFFP